MLLKIHTERIGEITRTHGVAGELIIRSELYLDELLIEDEPLFFHIEQTEVPFFIQKIRHIRNDQYAVLFRSIDSESIAKKYVGYDVMIKKDKLPSENVSSLFYQDYSFIDLSSGIQGVIIDHHKITGNDQLVVLINKQEQLIPLNEDFIKEINHQKKHIAFVLPEGLLDIN